MGRRRIGRTLIGLAVAAALPVSAAQATATPLGIYKARQVARNYVFNHWDPITALPYYSLATHWNQASYNCLRFTRYRIDCVMDANAENYYYDPLAEDWTGYAYCVGTLDVLKNRSTGHIRVRDEGNESCDSTYDLSFGPRRSSVQLRLSERRSFSSRLR